MAFKFNTAVSSMMIFLNLAEKEGLTKETYETFLKILSPFAPHLTEELWERAGNSISVYLQTFPQVIAEYLIDAEVTIGVQVNGKMKGNVTVAPDEEESSVIAKVYATESIAKHLGSSLQKVIYVQGKIINLIIKV